MSKKIDLTGQTFGNLKVTDEATNPSGGEARWVCCCLACGKTDHVVKGSLLRDGRSKSCGCQMGGAEDLTGRRFGRWEVLQRTAPPLISGGEPKGRGAWWMCRCDCDSKERPVRALNLLSGNSTSCGCYQKERAVEVHTGHAPYEKDPVKRVAHAKMAHEDLRFYGSKSTRPKHHLADTLHNISWLKSCYLVRRLSKRQMAELAGCSAVSVAYALRKFGVRRVESVAVPTALPKRRRALDANPQAKYEQHRIARSTVPLGPCVVCGEVGQHVNHKDRDPWNNDPLNLERVCASCHNRQHATEVRVMIEWLRERFGVDFIEVAKEARKRTLQEAERAPEQVTDITETLRVGGFPEIPEATEEEAKASLANLALRPITLDGEGILRPYTTVGTKVCNSFFPNRYHAKYRGSLSAWEAWHNDVALRKAVELQVESGDPTSPQRVLKAILFHHRTPSVFRPAVAKYVYETYAKGGVVWDPCAGYGGRLMGAMAAGVAKYIGTDVESETVAGNQALAKVLGVSDKCSVILSKAEEHAIQEPLDLVFTSPPYFDLEVYGDASEKAATGYGSVTGWLQGFLEPVLKRAFDHLRPGGHLVLNLPSKPIDGVRLDEAVQPLALALGFVAQESPWMPVRQRSHIRSRHKLEPLLVWRRP